MGIYLKQKHPKKTVTQPVGKAVFVSTSSNHERRYLHDKEPN